ncbi:MAG: hypothetical protein KGK07_16875 [Chloroflexota bacterium]|nr:hypothetical protein [Chloroflexota bacterium]
MALIDELRPHLVQAGADLVRTAAADFFRAPARAAQPERYTTREIERDAHGCPYCAAREHIWLAIGCAVDCQSATDPIALKVFERKLVQALDAAYRCLDTTEVLMDQEGASIASAVIRMASVRDGDYRQQALELYALKDRCVAMAVKRNAR